MACRSSQAYTCVFQCYRSRLLLLRCGGGNAPADWRQSFLRPLHRRLLHVWAWKCLLTSALMGFPRDEACIALLWEGANIVMFGFLDPGWNIFCGTWIAGQDSKYATNW